MCAGGPGSIPGPDKLDFGFHLSGVGEEQLVSSWVTITEDCGIKVCSREMVKWLMQPETQTAKRTWPPSG